jgi:hypothetical protein
MHFCLRLRFLFLYFGSESLPADSLSGSLPSEVKEITFKVKEHQVFALQLGQQPIARPFPRTYEAAREKHSGTIFDVITVIQAFDISERYPLSDLQICLKGRALPHNMTVGDIPNSGVRCQICVNRLWTVVLGGCVSRDNS